MARNDTIHFGSDLCRALGLDPSNVMRLTLTVEDPFTVQIEVKLVPTIDDRFTEVIERYEFVAKPKDDANG